jgi:hypothetical protein
MTTALVPQPGAEAGGVVGEAMAALTSGNTITIAPSINLVGTGSDAVDAQNLANQVIKIIETSDAVQALRTS